VAAVCYPCLTAVAVLATGNHFVLDILGGLVVMALAFVLVELGPRRSGSGLRRAFARLPGAFARPSAGAYRMSQSCYEVPDQVD
jgi:hypothetical protein